MVTGAGTKKIIFISYRRDDSADVAGRIYDRLVAKFGKDAIFKDVDTIPLGVDFRKHLNDAVGKCSVLLAVIGKQWLSLLNEAGDRRLDDPTDFVRIEIEAALQRDIPVVPLLVHGVSMPKTDEFPSSLTDLAYRNGLPVRRDPDFHRDMDRLINDLAATLETRAAVEPARAREDVPAPTPAPPPPRSPAPSRTLTAPIPLELVRVPAGEFLMGSTEEQVKQAIADGLSEGIAEREQPQHRVHVSEFYIGKYPITNTQYAAFVKATKHKAPKHWKSGKIPSGKEDHPVVYVSWNDAVAFCEWLSHESGQSFRLPTEAEWEKAARGTDGRIYPWGDEPPDDKRLNFNGNVKDTTPVGKYSPQGDSPYKAADMSGNVYDWCADWFDEKEYERRAKTTVRDPQGPEDGKYRVVRGGSWDGIVGSVRAASRTGTLPLMSSVISGFVPPALPDSGILSSGILDF